MKRKEKEKAMVTKTAGALAWKSRESSTKLAVTVLFTGIYSQQEEKKKKKKGKRKVSLKNVLMKQ